MKIAIFTDSFLPGVGGTENAVMNFALALSKEHQVMVLAPKYRREFNDDAFPFKIVRAKSIKITENDFWAMPKITKSLKRELALFKPDILHTQTLGMMADFANSYGKKHDIPVVCTSHTKYRYCYMHDLKCSLLANLVVKRIIKRANNADLLCAVSNSMSDELISYGAKSKAVIIKNGCNNKAQKFIKPPFNGKFNFVYVGLVSTIKNIDFTLKALALVKKQTSDFTFTIIGRGPDEKKLKKLAKKLNLSDNVVFTGVIRDRDLLNKYLLASNLFLFPSIFDSDGLVILEAACFGTPTLVLENTGASERITDGVTGFTAKADINAYADKILQLMGEKEKLLEVGKRACSIFTTWEDTATQYIALYNKVIYYLQTRRDC